MKALVSISFIFTALFIVIESLLRGGLLMLLITIATFAIPFVIFDGMGSKNPLISKICGGAVTGFIASPFLFPPALGVTYLITGSPTPTFSTAIIVWFFGCLIAGKTSNT